MLQNRKRIPLAKIFFYIYIILIIIFVLIKFNGSLNEIGMRTEWIRQNRNAGLLNLNLVPFRQISTYLKRTDSYFAIKNLIVNLFILFPLGFFVPILYDGKFFKTLAYSFLFSLLIELFQFITMLGFADIDDVILNIIGSFVGYLTFKLFHKLQTKTISKFFYTPSKEQ